MRLEVLGASVLAGGRALLDSVSFDAWPGEIVCVLGPSGAGKSTLARVMHLLRDPDAGEVRVDGEPVRDRLAAIRRMALVQQRPGLLRATALANVAFPLRARGVARPEAESRARRALLAVGLADRAGAEAATLSGGEAQRVALARAIVTRPDALLLDEATNQLDPENEERVESIIASERERGAAVVMVTHSVGQARRLADRVAFMDAGRVVEAGPAREVLDAARHPLVQRFVARA